MITAVTPDVDIVDMPFDDYIVKPIAKDELVRMVELLKRRADYDAKSRKYFRLASKCAKLRSSGNVDHNTNQEYRELREEIDVLRKELDETLSAIADDDPDRVYQRV
jgi:DNA-binding response OmpR family regulator